MNFRILYFFQSKLTSFMKHYCILKASKFSYYRLLFSSSTAQHSTCVSKQLSTNLHTTIPNFELLRIDISTTITVILYISNVLIFSSTKNTAIFFSFNILTYFNVSTVFLANLDIDFVIIISNFPLSASSIILIKLLLL